MAGGYLRRYEASSVNGVVSTNMADVPGKYRLGSWYQQIAVGWSKLRSPHKRRKRPRSAVR